MENSPANQLPEADSLPDGFVESSAESPAAVPTPDTDYKDTFLDADRPPSEDLQQDGRSDGAENPTSADPSTEKDGLCSSCGVAVEVDDKPLLPEPGNQNPKEPGESKLPGDSKGDCQNSERDTQGCLELHTSNVKECTERLKNQKLESSEAKRKVVKRSIKSEKELLEFTLKYQKVIAERDAAVAVRERLESLCRELQRQNKMLMDECQRVSTEGQNMRLELSTKFNDAIKDISIKLEEQKNDCISQLKENEMLRNKLKLLAEQYALSEQQFTQKLKQKTLELQLADLKLQQQRERSAQEQTQMQLYVEQVTQLLSTEKDLRSQLAADGEKFQQFQDALMKSNDVFDTLKQEMEKMAKLTKELKKENEFLKSKCEKTDIALVRLVEEREFMKKQVEKAKNQKEKLESLCRSLQAERKQNISGSTPADSVATQVKVDSGEEESSS